MLYERIISRLKTWKGWFLPIEGSRYANCASGICEMGIYVVAVTPLHFSFVWAGVLHLCLPDSKGDGAHGAHT